MNVEILDNNSQFWDQIDSSRQFSLYHTKMWKSVVEGSFGHKALYFALSENGSLLEVLPFFLVQKPLLGKKMISTPYEGCNGSFLSADASVMRRLVDEIIAYGQKAKVKYIEIRGKQPLEILKQAQFSEHTPFIISEVKLIDNDENWSRLSSKHRRNVRLAEKRGVKVRISSQLSDMKVFVDMLQNHYKEIGIPFFRKKYFFLIWDKIIKNDRAVLLIAEMDKTIVGGHLLFHSGNTLISKYSASLKDGKYKHTYASYALFWEAIKHGNQKKFENFNLGITGQYNSGLLQFKSAFGAETGPIHFYYYPVNGNIPDLSKYYDKYSAAKAIWKVSPRILTSIVGHKICEWLA